MKGKLLSRREIKELSQLIPEWEVSGDKLVRKLKFKNFVEAFDFMSQVAIVAEAMAHHPEWSNVYSDLTIMLTTHDLGGISTLDLKLAEAINDLKEN
ncbi:MULTISPECIES: 4a-hydroxytetrahydrobiopterin dehydratase [unclassified Prochlorococcus]|uniref:4a-hydroxytetrahydrobiopterin dehydratase n=1 Tax=unclassified Prochlorococcus TaxID=2627481 RepID=UPI00053399AB|nr:MULTISPECIES: 4a-hydroxytetrahydrobiopterin dehydratase [unclassified Prochlorococcus]KGG16468.1 Pterin-4-alpha-carbinolamine dehydratase [Prochlorococcus sp. MIT 0602]KGG17058.1 Pterin-4-alpha-carbinolamine dehydratase [Prochlorococcus sp. MIT 0603]